MRECSSGRLTKRTPFGGGGGGESRARYKVRSLILPACTAELHTEGPGRS